MKEPIENLEDLARVVHRLDNLLKDPQPGLAVWAVISDYWNDGKGNQ